jgi:hypothetical protein
LIYNLHTLKFISFKHIIQRVLAMHKIMYSSRRWWLTPLILATCEAEIRRILVWSQTGQIVCETLSWKNPSQKKAGGVAQVSALSSIKPQYCTHTHTHTKLMYSPPQSWHKTCPPLHKAPQALLYLVCSHVGPENHWSALAIFVLRFPKYHPEGIVSSVWCHTPYVYYTSQNTMLWSLC